MSIPLTPRGAGLSISSVGLQAGPEAEGRGPGEAARLQAPMAELVPMSVESGVSWQRIESRWELEKTERRHVIASSSDDKENLFLAMC